MGQLDGITDSMYMNLGKLEDSEGQGSLACCSPWGHKELDMTEQLHNDNDIPIFNVLRNLKSVFHSALQTFSPTERRGSNFSTTSLTLVIFWLFGDISPWFDLHFPDD